MVCFAPTAMGDRKTEAAGLAQAFSLASPEISGTAVIAQRALLVRAGSARYFGTVAHLALGQRSGMPL